MTTYYYAPYDDYRGFEPRRKSATLKGAMIGLRKALYQTGSESGIISTQELPDYPVERNPKGWVGVMSYGFGQKMVNRTIMGKKFKIPENVYFWKYKGDRKLYEVKSDGKVLIYERK